MPSVRRGYVLFSSSIGRVSLPPISFQAKFHTFFLSGKLKIQGLHFPPTVLEKGRMIALPIGVVDMAILEDTTWLAYRCNELPMLCDTHYEKFMHLRDECENGLSLEMIPPLLNFAEGIHQNLQNGALCQKFFEGQVHRNIVTMVRSLLPAVKLA